MSIAVAILGATGVVGQKAIALLLNDSRFKIVELVASDQRIGQAFGEVCDWRETIISLPPHIASIKMIDIDNIKADFIISCLPSEVAQIVEPLLASRGKFIFSNASTFRMNTNVPLIIPEINSSHFSLTNHQATTGKIITNPNCSAVGVAMALAPLMEIGEVTHASVVTLQSISGAGYPGVPSLDILGNTIPHIEDEAAKITEETKKILGSAQHPATFAVTTHVHRVPVAYGHTITLHLTFKHPVAVKQALNSYHQWNVKYPDLFVIHDKNGRPQAGKDLTHDDMRVHIGHLCQGDQANVIGLVSLTHNLVRGAAGAAITNMATYLNNVYGK